MPLHRRAFALLICVLMSLPSLAALGVSTAFAASPPPAAAPAGTAAAPPATAAPAEAPAGDAVNSAGAWIDDISIMIQDEAFPVLKTVGLALLLFIAGWLIAKAVAYVVYQALLRTELDDKLAELLRLDLLIDKKKQRKNQVERFFSAVVYYILMMLVVVAVLQQAGLSQAAAPIEDLVRTLSQALPNIAKAVGILGLAFAAGYILRKVIVSGLGSLGLDSKFAELSTDGEQKPGTDAKPFSQSVGNIVFYLLMLVGLASAFDALHIAPISEPLHNAIDKLVGALPSVGMAVVLLAIGWVLSRIVRVVLTNLLKGVGLDNIVERIGISSLFGKSTASAVVGLVASAFVLFQAVLAALNELGLTTLSEPLTDMMTRFWLLLPSIAVSLLVIVLSVVAGRLLRNVVATALRNLGFDKLMAKIGFGTIAEREDRLGEPSELAGFFLQIAVVMLAFAQAFENLELATWAAYVNLFLGYFLKHVLVAAAILGVGFGIGKWVRDIILARRDKDDSSGRWLGEFARYAVLVFAWTMAVHQLGVAEDFVLLTFGLMFGSLCLAMALAFGLGSRDVAGDIVRSRYNDAKQKTGGIVAKPRPRPQGAGYESGYFSKPKDDDEAK